jgi:serine O-acetyltransferase
LAPEAEIAADARFHHHALGVVIHPCVRVGRRVQIQHHVLLGADVPLASAQRMDVGDDVHIGAYAILLGPITVGEGAVIGAGAVVTRSVPAGATVVGNPGRVVAPPREIDDEPRLGA